MVDAHAWIESYARPWAGYILERPSIAVFFTLVSVYTP